ncbi:MAG: hypothetical protein J6T08_05745, partial [Lentisphaeria bacterium]|nr:hypothetical protein [Lentisphaeria bacterium]
AHPCPSAAKSTFSQVAKTAKRQKNPIFRKLHPDISIKITPYRKKFKFNPYKKRENLCFFLQLVFPFSLL